MPSVILLWDLGIIIVAATLLAYVAKFLRQPTIPAYVIAGILIGPVGFGLITNYETIRTLSELGIAFLLFIVGLELDLQRLKDVGFAGSASAMIRSGLLFGVGFLIAIYFGFLGLDAVYLGLALAFSSTMIVVKLLSDNNELDTLHGRYTLAILLAEDALAIIALSVLATADHFTVATIAISLLKGFGLFCISIVASRFLFPPIFGFVARSQELLFLTALSICMIFAKLSSLAGFSIAIGALIAGISIATFPYNIEIVSRIRSLRDFFVTIFFVSLGMDMILVDIEPLLLPALALIFAVVILKPLIIMSLSSLAGYGRRTSFLSSISLAQISEFSLIIVLQGVLLSHISHSIFSLTVIVALVTITLTPYLIRYDEQLYQKFLRRLAIFDKLTFRRFPVNLEGIPKKSENHIILCGAHRMGHDIMHELSHLRERFFVVDFNPDVIKSLMDKNIPCIYGDIGDIEILKRIDLKNAEMVISTVPNESANTLLITETRKVNPNVLIFVTADAINQAMELYDAGADYVIVPRMLSGEKISDVLGTPDSQKMATIKKMREVHLKELKHIREDDLLSRYGLSFLRHR